MEEFAKSLGIDKPGTMSGDKYIIDLDDSNEYSKFYSLLDKSSLVDLDTSSTLVNENVSELLYMSDDYDIKLVGNFGRDLYRIIITKGE